MARELRWWIAATLLACSVVGLVYLPPRGSSATRQRFLELEPPTPNRLRARALADQWRATSLQVNLMELRERIRPELARRRAAEVPGVFLVLTGSDTVSTAERRVVTAQLDTIWSRLGLGVTKISVAVVLRLGPATARAGEPLESSESGTAYLLPDSADRSTCVVLLSGRHWPRAAFAQPDAASNRRFTDWLESGLGPCAFYAAFGRPGRQIGRWLGARKFDLALNPWWNGNAREGPYRPFYDALDARQNRWFFMEVYRFPPDAIACLGGREARCRVAVLAGARDAGAEPHFVTTESWWRRQRLLAGDHYLADVVREVGWERFQSFWNSELSADTALAAALRKPVGEWTAQWQGRLIPPIRLGPAAPPSAVWLGLLLAGVAVGLVTRTVSRREVQ